MNGGENFNAEATPTAVPYVDELGLSPAPDRTDESIAVPTPKLMISPTQMPEPSLGVYKNENALFPTAIPTPASGEGTIDLTNTLLWAAMIFGIALFIAGIYFGLKNTPQKNKD